MDDIRLLPLTEHGDLTQLYLSAGLEIAEGWAALCHPVFSAAACQGDQILGGATVSRRFDRLVLDYLAVESSVRGLGLGKKLMKRCLEYAREAGEQPLWIAAKEPEFYLHLGAEETKDTALLEDCRRCPAYGESCQPKELIVYLKEDK